MRQYGLKLFAVLFTGLAMSGGAASGQTSGGSVTPDQMCRVSRLTVCVKDVLEDEAGIIVTPLRAPRIDLLWVLPFGAATGAAVEYDT